MKKPGGRVNVAVLFGDFCESIPNLLILQHGSAYTDGIYHTSCYVVVRLVPIIGYSAIMSVANGSGFGVICPLEI